MFLTGGWVEPLGPELDVDVVGAAAAATAATDPCVAVSADTLELSWLSSFGGVTVS